MNKEYILKSLNKDGLDHIELKLITGDKVSVYSIEEGSLEKELIEVLEPTKITVNLKYIVTIEEIYSPDFEALNKINF
ncbi:hypothetical protein NRV22_001542 [Staphylococcus pseudintermedius]|uniref:hypothetical protein n=1 Tax=Staphylococcus pseudintermedius TaxID=283734 RepID=UPI0022E9C174|nr:hypothetical protein [Staphylococcus pseudintermedius]EJO7149988.1 hypothetical protein [Staphylococcus pseudintermedius]MDA3102458.1 hypothetical protein [Staphylococcus pseudintermedius]MDK3728380.1 hypothetical protein [Staphylococcus pseudintermedius]MDK3812185.1 hypothetical protein [Staphylococcus pseudintermedius]MDK3828672.1 hypothetical protein [Staphylococcus pseudintermedius]